MTRKNTAKNSIAPAINIAQIKATLLMSVLVV
jgi:hypothetical protein